MIDNNIVVSDVNIFYDNKKVVRDINLTVEGGTIFGLLGPSGCGKTTLVKVISGIHSNYTGEVSVMGLTVPSMKILTSIGYMAQKTAIYENITGYDNLIFFGKLYSIKKDELELRIRELSQLVTLDKELKKLVRHYSEGMKQRLALAIALLAKPKVLILDEPTVGIDPMLKVEIWSELYKLSRDEGVTILVTTHIMEEAEKCDTVAIMRKGVVLADGSPSELKKRCSSSNLEEVFIKLVGGSDENRCFS